MSFLEGVLERLRDRTQIEVDTAITPDGRALSLVNGEWKEMDKDNLNEVKGVRGNDERV